MTANSSANFTTPSSAQIEAQIKLARDHKSNLEDKVRDLSLPAVSGDGEAAASLAAVQTQIAQVSADIFVLENAKVAAIGKEVAAAEAKTAEYRAHHLAIAKERAAALVELAGQADASIEALRTLLAQIRTDELAIWNALRAASAPPSDCVIGRKGLANAVIERVQLSASGQALFNSEKRPIAEIARTAWANVLDESHDI